MKVIEQRFKNLITILNDNIGKDLNTTDWTALVNSIYPYENVKPHSRWGTHHCGKEAHKQINANILTTLAMMGFVEKTEETPNSGKKVKYYKYRPIKEIPYKELNV